MVIFLNSSDGPDGGGCGTNAAASDPLLRVLIIAAMNHDAQCRMDVQEISQGWMGSIACLG